MKWKSVCSSLSSKFKDNSIKFVKGFDLLKPKTQIFDKAIGKIAPDGSVLCVIPKANFELVARSLRNISRVSVILATNLTTYDIIKNKTLIIAEPAVKDLFEAVLQKK